MEIENRAIKETTKKATKKATDKIVEKAKKSVKIRDFRGIILTKDYIFLSAQPILSNYAIWAVPKLENLNIRQYECPIRYDILHGKKICRIVASATCRKAAIKINRT